MDIETSDFSQTNNDLIYISPMLSFGKSQNPFTAEKRTYPIDFGYPKEEQISVAINIPEGYGVEDAPKSARLKLGADNDIKFEYTVEASAKTYKMISKFTLKRYQFGVEEYEGLKKFFDQILSKHAQQLVLKKIKTDK